MTFVSLSILLSFCSHRYRFVAGFVTELLVRGYQQPALLLDEYISQAIGCEINRGAEKQAKLDDIELELRDTFNFKKLGESARTWLVSEH